MPAGRRRERLAQWLAEELPCDSRTGSLLLIRESPTPGECSTAQRGKVARCSARSTALSPRLPKWYALTVLIRIGNAVALPFGIAMASMRRR